MIQTDKANYDKMLSRSPLFAVAMFAFGAIVAVTGYHAILMRATSEPDLQAMRAEQAYEYCLRVDAYRADRAHGGYIYPNGHDDFRGIYDEVCK